MITTSNEKQTSKDTACNSVILAQLLYETLKTLPGNEALGEVLLDYQRKTVVQLPQQTQQWIMKEIAKEKVQALPPLFRQHINVVPGIGEVLYKGLSDMIDFTTTFKGKARNVDPEKYRLFVQLMRAELGADLTGGTPCLSAESGTLSIKFALPVNKEVEDE